MRIFYASETSPNATFHSNLWRHNLYEPLVELGHDVVEFQYDLRETFQKVNTESAENAKFIARNRPRISKALLAQIKAAHAIKPVDLFFSYFYDACVQPETLDAIRGMGITTVNWYCNGSYQLHLVKEISPHYDWCLVPEKFRLPDYVAMGARPIYCQEAANPNIYRPHDVPQEFDVTFVGQAYGDRPAYIARLLQQGIDVRVWGYGWREMFGGASSLTNRPSRTQRATRIVRQLARPEGRRKALQYLKRLAGKTQNAAHGETDNALTLPPHILGGVLDDNAMIEMYSRSKINLGFSTCGNTHRDGERIVQVRLRDFEVPMSGGFYMVEYMEELEEFFDIGREIVCYTDRDDLATKIRYYLEHTEEREAIRHASHQRCRRDHTWHRRFRMAFEKMGLSPTGSSPAGSPVTGESRFVSG